VPPIDPAVLRSQTTALAARLGEPRAAAAGVRALLDDYADRSHRPSPRLVGSEVENAYKTPGPVLRAVVSALRDPARADPTAALALADALWAGDSREERRLAAEILGLVAIGLPGEALEMVERWLPQLESGSTADALAELGLGPLVRLDPPTYLAHAQRWAALPDKWARRFALALLRPLAADRHWDNIPGALVVIRRVMADPDADVRRAAAEVLAALAPKSPPEMARFLREQAGRSNSHTHWIVRHAMTALDPAAQAEIVKRLRS